MMLQDTAISHDNAGLSGSFSSTGSAFEDTSSSHGGSSSGGDFGNTKQVKREANTLSVIRVLVITTLLTLAAIVSNITFLLVLHDEENQFEEHLNIYAQDILKNFLEEVEMTYWMADSLSGDITAFANDAGAKFPFVSLPDFGQRCQDARRVALASTIWFAPLVQNYERAAWEIYASQTFPTLVDESFVDTYDPHQELGLHRHGDLAPPYVAYRDTGRSIDQGIFKIQDDSAVTDDTNYFFPIWQISTSNETAGSTSTIMFNQYSEMARRQALSEMISEGGSVMTEALLTKTSESVHDFYVSPTSSLYFPVFDTPEQKTIGGALTIEVDWESFFQKALYGVEVPVMVVLENSCGQIYSFEVIEKQVMYLGEGDMHDDAIQGPSANSTFKSFEEVLYVIVEDEDHMPMDEEFDITDEELQHEHQFVPSGSVCSYRIFVYPTTEMRDHFLTNKPIYFQAAIAMIFLFTTAIFIFYECLVESRQRKIEASAKEARAVVNSLFPKNVRKRLYENANKKGERNAKFAMASMQTPKNRLKKFLSEGAGDIQASEPIADLFPNATIMFADISGFTAWSSEREPSQVFTLLETIYGAMDTAARKLGVFKVETVGDTYVAATGLPEQRDDHAVVMARFARSCLVTVKELTRAMEASLGPGTADLAMRFGMHSGPVTAGVLRGEKSRFQLFGDTMNTAARMESTGVPGKIQMSKDTAKYITDVGKCHWLVPRKEVVTAKGKGEMRTFWLKISSKTSSRTSNRSMEAYGSDSEDGDEEHIAAESQKQFDRLVDWNAEILLSILQRIVARRQDMVPAQDIERRKQSKTAMDDMNVEGGYLLDEVKEVVNLPAFDPMLPGHTTEAAAVVLSRVVKSELRDYVAQIAAGYKSNPFHNLEHASHVCLSANKLLKRIVESDDVDYRLNTNEKRGSAIRAVAADLHKHTYGISSDPLTHFAAVFSALIHDVGHTGVPNGQLAKEHPEVALKYRNQAIAEQRSVDIAWELLSAPCYSNLRSAIFSSQQERTQFRELVVNSVLATDIFDKQMTAVRKSRWNKAFYGKGSESSPEQAASESSPEEDMNRKATIVIEHIIQASDVAHTMQHWHIYLKWNERLFTEMYRAFKSGRSEKDPAEGWYKGELWFFDNYVIPLAKKLENCGVFGVSSDEYLNYAVDNREEWERKGQDVVAAMVARCARKSICPQEGAESEVQNSE